MKTEKYKPDDIIAPGETVKEMMIVKGASFTGMVAKLKIEATTLRNLLKGKEKITDELAMKFEKIFGVPAQFFINLERNYRELLELREKARGPKKKQYGCGGACTTGWKMVKACECDTW